jgi:EAL domain-containing protein (putative c-di-GMP-specific phosphodiesterase class I)
MNTRAVERQSLESGLRLALERQEFALHYQPQLNLETGAITGVEALIRWIHPERGLVPPAQFISIAEETGLILSIGQWVLHEACRQAKAWMSAGLAPARMAVNISAVQFRSKRFFEGVRAILADIGFDPKYLELELTETVLMEEATSTVSVLRALKDMGVQIAIDDFGTGYSSLSYLTRFPIDTLKIDRSFVNEITTNPDAATIVSAVIGMGKNLDLKVIAEGIETQGQLAFLRSHRCAEGQGYYFSRPVTGAAFAELLQSGVQERLLN